jgi:6-phosphofructokinase 1
MSVAVIAHSGGPTPVMNASLLGVCEETARHPRISLLGARHGIAGIENDDFVDLSIETASRLKAVSRTPASALGTSRRKPHLDRILQIFRARDVRWFLYTGGNGSMGTARDIEKFARDSGYELNVVGIPKTIDNDLAVTDHTPGYASTARFFAQAVRDIDADNRALPGQVEIVEVLGRNVGWLAAATSLGRGDESDGPHLVYLPEHPLPRDKFLGDVERVFTQFGRCVVAVCEGQLDAAGEPFGADVRSGSGGQLAMNLGHALAKLVMKDLGIRARSEKPGLLGRATSAFVENDWLESHLCGAAAARAAYQSNSGEMITLERAPGSRYAVTTGSVSLDRVANVERLFPSDWMNANGTGVLAVFRDWAAPLVGEVHPFPRLC